MRVIVRTHWEAQLLEVALDLPEAEAVGQRHKDVHGLARNALLLVRRHGGDGAHVVQPVRQLHHQHAASSNMKAASGGGDGVGGSGGSGVGGHEWAASAVHMTQEKT
jgi:hypothetical protein